MSPTSRLIGALFGLGVALPAAALPASSLAEGNRLVLACEPLDAPAEEGTDAAPAPAGPVGFTFAPLKVDRAGSGRIEVTTPTGEIAPGVTASFQGPYAWTKGTTLHTLTVEGTTEDGRALVLWHRLDQAQAAVPPAGTLTKLICEVS